MKKQGFTLAEVLITLGIVGVIAAIAMPAFNTNMQSAKIGPQLAKAKADYEQALMAVLNDAQADTLSDAMVCPSTKPNCNANERVRLMGNLSDFWYNIGKYLNGSFDGNWYTTTNGVRYSLASKINQNATAPIINGIHVHNWLDIDINGNQEPNEYARDTFKFALNENGTILPYGSHATAQILVDGKSEHLTDGWWESGACQKDVRPGNPELCAGHIFENGLKAEYK